MALNAKVGSFNSGTATAGNTVVVNDVGFEPKVVIFWWNGRTDTTDAAGAANHQRGCGVAVSTTSRHAVTTQSQTGQGSAVADQGHRQDACVYTLTTAGGTDGLLDLQSFESTGLTLVVDDQFASSIRIHYLALGGDDITNIARGIFAEGNTPGIQSVTTGFQPDCVIFMTQATGGDPSAVGADSRLTFGIAAGATPVNYGWTGGTNDTAATMQTVSYSIGGESLVMCTASVDSVSSRGLIDEWLSDGFSLTWNELGANSRTYLYLAIKGGKYAVGDLLTLTNTTTDITETGLGFSPKAVLFVSHCKAQSTANIVQDHDEWSMGACSSTSDQRCFGTIDVDNTADSTVATAVEHDNVYVNLSTSQAVEGAMAATSIDADGFKCRMTDADPAQAFVWYLAVGSSSSATEATGSAAGTSTASAVGASTAAASGSAAGTATAAAAGQSTAEASGSAAGTATASADGTALVEGSGSATGTSSATAVVQSTAAASGSAAGVASAASSAESTSEASGSAAGVATAAGAGASTAEATGSAAGTAAASATGTGIREFSGSAAGTSTAAATSQATSTATGSAAGSGAAAATGRSTTTATGDAAGTSAVSAVGESTSRASGTAVGTSSASAVGSSIAESAGSAGGTSNAEAFTADIEQATGSAAGTSAASAVGASTGQASGSAAGSAAASAAIISLFRATGSASGLSTAAGVAQSLAAAVAVAVGLSSASAVGSSIAQAEGSASGSSSAAANTGESDPAVGPVQSGFSSVTAFEVRSTFAESPILEASAAFATSNVQVVMSRFEE